MIKWLRHWERLYHRCRRKGFRLSFATFHLDPWLLLALLITMILGLVVLYSASGELVFRVEAQAFKFIFALFLMCLVSQIPPPVMMRWSWWLYAMVVLLLIAVDIRGYHAMGAQRWLELPIIGRFQPSELLKLILPLTLAAYLARRPLPISLVDLAVCLLLTLLPVALVLEQPDLGTAMLVLFAAMFVILLAGVSWRLVLLCVITAAAILPLLWLRLHDYQRQRVCTFLNPESDPLGAGWNIIQSKTAIGSGGLWGKGWMDGSQSQLQFLPERHTDFIVAVLAEEFGLIGMCILLALYLFIIARGFYIALNAHNTFSRLLSGSLILTFFIYVFVNIGMVSGLLPIVGVPLPLISYGGTANMTLLIGFGIIMSIATHRKLIKR